MTIISSRSKFTGSASAIALLGSMLATPVYAQDADEADNDSSVIVVTAQKREQQLIDVPLAVQAISGEQLEDEGIKELNDLIESIPGASSVSRTAPGFETIQIRGISSGTTGDATVGYYVDDVPFSVPNLQLAPPSRLFDLQRVEVLRGPQGTLYGQGAMGGTIRMVTASPDLYDTLGRAQVEASTITGGEFSYALDGVVNVPVIEEKVALRVSGGYESVGGFADSTALNLQDINDSESWNVRAKLLIAPTEDISLELGAWRVENSLDFRNTMDSANPPIIDTVSTAGGRQNLIDSSLTLISAVFKAEIGDTASVTSSTAFIDHQLDFDSSFLAGGILGNDSTFDTTTITQELRFASNGDGPFSWVFGGYYSGGEVKSDICLNLALPCTTVFSLNINSAGRLQTDAFALFGELSYALLDDRLVATVGGRQFWDTRKSTGFDRNTNTQTINGATFKTFNPRFNLSFKVSENFLVYTNVAKGFRSGAFQTAAQAAAASAALGITIDTAIQPDKVWSYEAGAKGRLFDGLIILDASVYRIDWSNIQLQSTITGIATLSNGGNARSEGIDLGLTIRPVTGLQFQFIGNINETEFTSVLPAIVAINPLAAPGTRIPAVPKTSFQTNASYTWDFAGWDAEGFIRGGYTFRNSQLDSSGLVSDELNEFNLQAGISKDSWKFQIFGDNITNKRVALTRGALGVQPNLPRRIGARFSIDF